MRKIVIILSVCAVVALAVAGVLLYDRSAAKKHFTKCKEQFARFTMVKTVTDEVDSYRCTVKLSTEEWKSLREELVASGWWGSKLDEARKKEYAEHTSIFFSAEESEGLTEVMHMHDDQDFLLLGRYYEKNLYIVEGTAEVLLGVELYMHPGNVK